MATVFLAAFLLFQLELIISKLLLPLFGGSFYVWTTCVMFFQGILFLGYSYCFIFIRKRFLLFYTRYHLFLILLSLLFLPFTIHPPSLSSNPVLQIFIILLSTICFPFFILSTTSVLFQNWLSMSEFKYKDNTYFLYAASNAGSLLALLSYPFLIELFFNIKSQLFIWYIGYFVFCLLSILCRPGNKMIAQEKNTFAQNKDQKSKEKISLPHTIYWLILSVCASACFLSTTNIITLDIAPIPFLWIIPLSLYLLSFILSFKRKQFYPEFIKQAFLISIIVFIFFNNITIFLSSDFLSKYTKELAIFKIILINLVLFLCCLLCNGEIVRTKPKKMDNAPFFYLLIALGSLLGSVFITVIIPLISNYLFEFEIILLLIIFIFILYGFFKVMQKINFSKFLLVFQCITFILIISYIKLKNNVLIKGSLYAVRNFYGLYRVVQKKDQIIFYHGTTMHGKQYSSFPKSLQPLAYFHPHSPVASVFKVKKTLTHIGIAGLGTGSLLAYSKKNQQIDYYELDPEVVAIAKKYFTYIKNSIVKPNFIIGDFRVSLQKSKDNYYDLIILDAFNSDAVPVHLLTREAIQLYQQKLTAKGIIIFNISNRYLDLTNPIHASANVIGMSCLKGSRKLKDIKKTKKGIYDESPSVWMVLTSNKEVIRELIKTKKWWLLKNKISADSAWTDHYVNIITSLKIFQKKSN